MTQLQQIRNWIRDAGQTIDRDNEKQIGLYIALCCEELSEALEPITPWYSMARSTATAIRNGEYDRQVQAADRQELLDAAIDLIWVATGLAASLGADVEGALGEVIRSNDSKRNPDGSMSLDATGKVIKGANYTAPDLRPFLPKEPA